MGTPYTMIITLNQRTYTRQFALLPTRMSSGQRVWFDYYYIRPDYQGQGVLLSLTEFLLETDYIRT